MTQELSETHNDKWTDKEKLQLSQLKNEGKSYSEIGEILGKTTDITRAMDQQLTYLNKQLNAKLIQEIKSCSQQSIAVNIKNMTGKLQLHYNSLSINLSSKYWQTQIAKTMAKTLTMLNFQEAQNNIHQQQIEGWECSICKYFNNTGEICQGCSMNEKKDNDDIKQLINDEIEVEEILSEPGAELKIDNIENKSEENIWIQIQHDIEEQERKLILEYSDNDNNNTNIISQWDPITVRWKTHSNFKIESGITTTQICKINGEYSSIYSLEPMIGRKFKYTFMLSNICEINKPWIGIGIISSKCPLLSRNKQIAWHASNIYSIGWYYGTDIWHGHCPLKNNYGNGSYWKSGDEIEMIVDCKNYNLAYKLNGMDLGIAAYNFDKLMDSNKHCHFYVIISIQQTLNSITLMDAYREKHNNGLKINNLNVKNNNNKWIGNGFFNEFISKKNVNINDESNEKNRSKSVGVSSFKNVFSKNNWNKENNKDIKLLRNKLELQTKISAKFKYKWESLKKDCIGLENKYNKNEIELKKLKEKFILNEKELYLSRGLMHELKKLSIHKLHELESHLLSSLQNVQKAIAQQYENKYDCRVCMTNEKDTVLIPCGHFLCSQCVEKVKECPMCRANIEKSFKLN